MNAESPRRRDTPRKQRAVDAAIEVIAADGLRGLTHRAVDAAAGLPPGSTSSCFRTRPALVNAVLDRIVELDQASMAAIPEIGWGIDTAEQRAEIVDMLTDLLDHSLGPARSRTLARLELYLDAPRRGELEPELAKAYQGFYTRVAAGMRAVGVADPDEAAQLLIAQLDGLLYDALARPYLGGGRRNRLRRAVDVIVRGYVPG